MTEIDMTPTWHSILEYLLVGYEDGTSIGRKIAREELYRMASIADKYNELVTKLDDDKIAQTILKIDIDADHEVGAAELAEGIVKELFGE